MESLAGRFQMKSWSFRSSDKFRLIYVVYHLSQNNLFSAFGGRAQIVVYNVYQGFGGIVVLVKKSMFERSQVLMGAITFRPFRVPPYTFFCFGAVYKGRPPKYRIFKPPLPLSRCVRISKTTPLPGRPRPDFSIFTHFSIFTVL